MYIYKKNQPHIGNEKRDKCICHFSTRVLLISDTFQELTRTGVGGAKFCKIRIHVLLI